MIDSNSGGPNLKASHSRRCDNPAKGVNTVNLSSSEMLDIQRGQTRSALIMRVFQSGTPVWAPIAGDQLATLLQAQRSKNREGEQQLLLQLGRILEWKGLTQVGA